MGVIFILIGCSLSLALVFLLAFFWSVKSGQNDDLHTPAIRMLFEDEPNHDKH
jgi:cbb3-type cytochrome oxidase maturation protein